MAQFLGLQNPLSSMEHELLMKQVSECVGASHWSYQAYSRGDGYNLPRLESSETGLTKVKTYIPHFVSSLNVVSVLICTIFLL